MNLKEAITKGIGAHGLWKQRLVDAINSGKSQWTPEGVCQDNQCDFGKWLYSLGPTDRQSPHCEKVRDLHAQFHKAAANVLTLALSGKTQEATNAISDNSAYRTLSASLTKEMMAWRDKS